MSRSLVIVNLRGAVPVDIAIAESREAAEVLPRHGVFAGFAVRLARSRGEHLHILVLSPVAVAVEPGPLDRLAVLQVIGKVFAALISGD